MSEGEPGLKKTLSGLHLWGIAVGLVISGEYFGWSYGWALAGTLGFLVTTVFIAVMYTTFIFSFTELTSAIPHAGGPFAYSYRAFGPLGGYLAGFSTLIEFVFAPPAIALAIGAYLNEETWTFRSTSELRNESGARPPVKSDNALMPLLFTRALRLKVRSEAYAWLNAAAVEVNQVFNYCNETSLKAATRTDLKRKWLTGFDLCALTAGATEYFDKIGADTIQSVCNEYARKRKAAKKLKLKWRASRGAKRSLGWIPFKAASLKRKGLGVRFAGKCIRVFERERLEGVKWQGGEFAQDAVGDWWLCLPVKGEAECTVAPEEEVGIDLGLKTLAVTSDGDRLEAGRWTRRYAQKLASAQRRGHKRQAKRIHRKIARCRADALHKFSRQMVDRYQHIVVGDVNSRKLVKTRMAKSVLDSGWGMLKRFLAYKCEHAARTFEVRDERYSTVTCSHCRALSGPRGVNGLIVRSWRCCNCGTLHDRDVNSARNHVIGSRCRTSVRGNELSYSLIPPSNAYRVREAGIESARTAA